MPRKRPEIVSVRVNKAELQKINALAVVLGLSRSEMARRAVLDWAQRVVQQPAPSLAETAPARDRT